VRLAELPQYISNITLRQHPTLSPLLIAFVHGTTLKLNGAFPRFVHTALLLKSLSNPFESTQVAAK
jgi:hypothetical protein